MFDLYNNIKQLCIERGISVSAMCQEIGMSKSTLSNLKNGRTETITPSTAKKIAAYLNVSLDDVMHGAKKEPTLQTESGLSPQQAELIRIWDSLDASGRAALLADANALAENRKSQDNAKSN